MNNRTRVTDRDHIVIPVLHRLLDLTNHVFRSHSGTGWEFARLPLTSGQQLYVGASDIDHQDLGPVRHQCFPTMVASNVAFFSVCPPNAKRIAESNLSAKSASPRELKR